MEIKAYLEGFGNGLDGRSFVLSACDQKHVLVTAAGSFSGHAGLSL